MKEIRAHLGLLAIGAIAVLVYLLRQKSASAAPVGVSVAAPNLSPASYPNVAPIKMGNIEVGGSPINLTYNTYQGPPPDTQTTADLSGCAAGFPGQPVSVQKISDDVFQAAADNLASFQSKTSVTPPSHPVARPIASPSHVMVAHMAGLPAGGR